MSSGGSGEQVQTRSPALVIVDCDPGVDDILALLLAALSWETRILAYTVTFGNTSARHGARNILKMFHALAKEAQVDGSLASRAPHLFEPSSAPKPLLAIGAQRPLQGQTFNASYYHGVDGLASIDTKRPDLTPLEMEDWLPEVPNTKGQGGPHPHLSLSKKPAFEVILDLLRENETGAITIVALGPLTNLALAFEADPTTFRRVGSIVTMGGTLDLPGNVGPHSEFNFYADANAARALISASPALPIILLPLDITSQHLMERELYERHIKSKISQSPLCDFLTAFLDRTFQIAQVYNGSGIEVHDPLAMAAAILFAGRKDKSRLPPGWAMKRRPFDIETTGTLTRGMCVVDRRMDALLQKGQTRSESRLKEHETKMTQETDLDLPEAHLAGGPAVKDLENGQAAANELDGQAEGPGCQVVTRTTGQDAFNQSWFERVLNIDLGHESMLDRSARS